MPPDSVEVNGDAGRAAEREPTPGPEPTGPSDAQDQHIAGILGEKFGADYLARRAAAPSVEPLPGVTRNERLARELPSPEPTPGLRERASWRERRKAVGPLDVERLAQAIWLVQHNTAADHYDRYVPPGSPHRAEVDEIGAQVASEYDALSQRDGERAYERGEDHP